MHNAHYALGNAPIIAMMYTNALGRFGLADNLCRMSMAQVVAATGEDLFDRPGLRRMHHYAAHSTLERYNMPDSLKADGEPVEHR